MNIDCVTFFNEIDLLECRIKYLWDLMDYFVIVESNVTHTGRPKRMVFDELKSRFQPYMKKIIYAPYYFDNTIHTLDFSKCSMSYMSPNWVVERLQRNSITNAVAGFGPEDVIFISDVDEIPEVSAAQYASKNLRPGMDCAAFPQEIFHYYLRFKVTGSWIGTSVAKNRLIQEHGAQWMRDRRWGEAEVPRLRYGGWHLSYFGGISTILDKLPASANVELNTNLTRSQEENAKALYTCKSLYDHQAHTTSTIVDSRYFPPNFYEAFNIFDSLTY